MVFALYGLAAAMVAGGAWLVIQGFELIVLERGWTMVIGGAVLATGGILLFGIARAIAALHRIEAAVQRGVDRMARGALPDAPPPRPNLSSLAGMPELAVPAGTGHGAATVAAVTGDEAAADPHRARISTPSLPEPPVAAPLVAPVTRQEALGAEPSPPAAPEDRPVGASDEFGFAGLLRGTQGADEKIETTPADAAEAPAEESRFAEHFEEPIEPVDETEAAVEPALDEQPDPETIESAPKEDEAEELVVIGTYNSGGNNYVMYGDGSIQADTPTGRYKFASLEELKEFIAAGGEDQLRSGRT
jgi:hypothetical protein